MQTHVPGLSLTVDNDCLFNKVEMHLSKCNFIVVKILLKQFVVNDSDITFFIDI